MSIKYERALNQLLWETVYEDQDLGPLYVLQVDVSNGFYRIVIQPGSAPKMGLFFQQLQGMIKVWK